MTLIKAAPTDQKAGPFLTDLMRLKLLATTVTYDVVGAEIKVSSCAVGHVM